MDYKILAFICAVIALFCFINAMDYREDYKRHATWYRVPGAVKFLRETRRSIWVCAVWTLIWSALASIAWFI